MLAHFRLITSGRPRVRRTVVVDSLVEQLTSISVIITREWRSQALILLFWAFLEVKAGFRVIPTKLFGKRPSSPVKTAEM